MSTFKETAVEATELFRTFKDGRPDLIDIGIKPVRRHIGGLFGGNIIVIGAPQNTGKTSTLLEMLVESEHRGGVISTEDGKDVWGARILAKYSDVKPTRIRKKDLNDGELQDIRDALKIMPDGHNSPLIEYRIGASLETVVEATHKLRRAGARWVALDYLQKIRGNGSGERRCEVGNTMVSFQRACAEELEGIEGPAVPIIMSQLVRLVPGQEPFPHHCKESGDIENEARMILLLWRDAKDPLLLRGKVAKSSFGGGGLTFSYRFTDAEYLEYVEEDKGKW